MLRETISLLVLSCATDFTCGKCCYTTTTRWNCIDFIHFIRSISLICYSLLLFYLIFFMQSVQWQINNFMSLFLAVTNSHLFSLQNKWNYAFLIIIDQPMYFISCSFFLLQSHLDCRISYIIQLLFNSYFKLKKIIAIVCYEIERPNFMNCVFDLTKKICCSFFISLIYVCYKSDIGL